MFESLLPAPLLRCRPEAFRSVRQIAVLDEDRCLKSDTCVVLGLTKDELA